jgi:transglutaminase TgpA-like protein/transglutaminase superfamily protein
VPYWRLAVLTEFDGEQWLPPTRYTRAGLGVPAPSGAAGHEVTSVAQSVTIEGLEGPFLPSMDRPVRIGPPVTAVDADSGMLITNPSVHRGLTYTVSSLGARNSADGTCVLSPSTAGDRALAYPPELASPLKSLVGSGCTGSFAVFANELEQRLNTGRSNLAGVPSAGTSIGVLSDFLRPGGTGTVVEFAASFALAVRAAGIPSRLVVGFGSQSTVAGQAHDVYGRDVALWVDVFLPGRGWTAYHPTTPPATAPGPAGSADTTIAPPSSSPSPSPSPSVSASPSRPTSGSGPVGPMLGTVGRPVALATAGVVVGYLVTVLLVPTLRRQRRRRQRLPRVRGLGAWHDVLDELAYAPARHATGLQLRTATPGSTRLLLLQRCAGINGEIGHLTRTTEACMFAATEPSGTDVGLAWKAAARIRVRLRRRAGWYRRICRVLSWRNLRLRSTWL